ncbi:AAA family ATPase [Bradyrhizobium sp. 26S5]|uniref:AAA family ATPase n=1 Tax=Bradyrhizobium sp. 26S5 TaxID=3139729 RepID=UPI0030D2D15B
MDLLYFGQEPTANRLFNSYVQTTWDAQSNALSLLPLFLSMRAAIRANVLFTTRRQHQSDQTITAYAKRYFQLARRLIEPRPSRLLAIGGKSGTGKSVLARDMAYLIVPPPGALVLRSDVIRKQPNQVTEHTTLPPEAYTPEASDRVYQAMLDRAGHAVAQGISVILDAAFLQQAERDAAKAVARSAKVEFSGIFQTANDAARLQRVASRRHDASDATIDVVNAQATIDTGHVDWEIVDASGSPATTLRRSMSCLRNASCPSGVRTAP